uniref:MHD domain-containing protein n=1 Tax=Arcella intermedia TaxID=1963864 RepID=A0A6B2L5F7_9EUKA|eukprot:TRINITY_DN336_c0_g1_i1.p1 TRINITY_DN336_c0_g1~~TRINITY_DN336_c0_g1_i1.p1  ORF type:complete len:416 (-),score=63.09 TRINITY_DN336_c0_g1_i1:63-1310(-)
MIQSIFILDKDGRVIVEKNFRGIIGRTVVDQFADEVVKHSPFFTEVPPVIVTQRYYLIHVQTNGVFFLAVVSRDVVPLLVLEFLTRVSSIFSDYFGNLNEHVLRDNFITAYQLLEEMNDGGHPFNLEPNILTDMIEVPNLINQTAGMVLGPGNTIKSSLPDSTLSRVPWRKANVKYTTNEIYIDIIDEIDAIIESNGSMTTSRISGSVVVDCQLSGVPDLVLRFQNPGIMEDLSFHPCVLISRWEREQVLAFVPPDGKFKLLEFRSKGNIMMPIYVQPHISFSEGTGTMSVMVGTKNVTDKVIEDILVKIPFPSNCSGISLTSKVGTVDCDENTKLLTWRIRGLTPKQPAPILEGSFAWDAETVPIKPVLSVEFTVNTWSASGLKVDSLTLLNENYSHFKGVKSLTKGGKIQIRL